MPLPSPETRQGKLVTLRPVREADLEELRVWYNHPENFPFMGRPAPLTEESQRRWFHSLADDPGAKVFAVVRIDNDRLIGSITLRNLHDPAKRGELGILMGEGGSGYGTDAIRTMLSHAFGPLSLNSVSLEVRGDNRRAITAYMRSGFRPEGVLRRRMFKSGALHDLYSMSILREEFLQDRDES